jgi:hypothetical protein
VKIIGIRIYEPRRYKQDNGSRNDFFLRSIEEKTIEQRISSTEFEDSTLKDKLIYSMIRYRHI